MITRFFSEISTKEGLNKHISLINLYLCYFSLRVLKMKHLTQFFSILFISFILPLTAYASSSAEATGINLDLTTSWIGITSLVVFVIAYMMVIGEEFLHLRKSKPVILAAGIIWALIGVAYAMHGDQHTAGNAIRHNLLEFAELMLFLLAAMTYINTMQERGVFEALRAWLVSHGFSLRKIFWITGLLAFFISPVADNLTTALLMGAVVMAVGRGNAEFVLVGCINIVIAANAGGAFSPFGDITTLMVWQKGIVEFSQFFDLFLPSAVNWLIPATIMSFAVSKNTPKAMTEKAIVKKGGYVVIGLFIITICLAVSAHNFLHLPPVLGMMTGLGILKFYGFYLRRIGHLHAEPSTHMDDASIDISDNDNASSTESKDNNPPANFDIFTQLARAEWDTLMFFYGVVLAVGGLGTIGYLAITSEVMYVGLGATWANILVGVLSAIVDNIPVMFAVLTMNPTMDLGQWLLVTLTAGVGGSLLSIGSAAGVALMGQARGIYTFFGHLKWTWAIALGYAGSIWVHMLINM